jgi:hypothetical protein
MINVNFIIVSCATRNLDLCNNVDTTIPLEWTIVAFRITDVTLKICFMLGPGPHESFCNVVESGTLIT